MSIAQVEHVLVVPTAVFHRLGHFQGFSTDTARYVDGLLRAEHLHFMPRPAAELDPSFKQLIPYVIFRHQDPQRGTCLFQYTRGRGQGEARLHAKRSIGVGGHISQEDAGDAASAPRAAGDLYEVAMQRELAEEVFIDTPYTAQCAGLINDDLTEVGKVHLGIVHILDVAEPAVRNREEDVCAAGFEPLDALRAEIDRFETWSQICLKALFR